MIENYEASQEAKLKRIPSKKEMEALKYAINNSFNPYEFAEKYKEFLEKNLE